MPRKTPPFILEAQPGATLPNLAAARATARPILARHLAGIIREMLISKELIVRDGKIDTP